MSIKRTNCSKFKREAYAKSPVCVYCGVTTTNVSPPDGATHPWHMATIDHVKPRRECKTQAEYNAASNKVMSCMRCNKRRDIVEDNAFLDYILDEIPMRLWWRVKLLRDATREAVKCVEHLYYALKPWVRK